MNLVNNEVFQENQEIDRLLIQNSLLKGYEQPIYDRVIGERFGLTILDIGCNNGSKTVDRFGSKRIAQLIGLEYLGELAEAAKETYGNDRFAFYQCDVEAPEFVEKLTWFMKENNIKAFDIIHISFVLMHLKDPGILLLELRNFLTPDGQLIIVEANDAVSAVSPDSDQLFKSFLNILYQDPFSGDRDCGKKIPLILEEIGYVQISLENTLICAGSAERKKKNAIFETFFSYLKEDVLLLHETESENILYAAWQTWIEMHFDQLKSLILAETTMISMGVSIITCLGG